MTKTKIGILTAASMQMSSIGLVGIVPMAINHYSDVNPTVVQTAFTTPMLMAVVSSLASGVLSAKLGKRALLLFGIAMIGICGIMPGLISLSFPLLVLTMAGLGIGIGCILPNSAGLIADHFSGHERSDMMGKQSASVSTGKMLIAFLGGVLMAVGWRNAFFVFLYAVPIFIINLFCLPKDKSTAISPGVKPPAGTLKLNGDIIVICIITFFYSMMLGTFNANSGLLVVERNLGDPAIANFATSAMSLIGIMTGLSYGLIAKKVKNATLPAGLGLFALGMAIAGNSSSVLLFYIGCILAGISVSIVMAALMSHAAQVAGRNSVGFVVSLAAAVNGLGNFLAPIIINPVSQAIAGGTITSRFSVGAVIISITFAAASFYMSRYKNKQTLKT